MRYTSIFLLCLSLTFALLSEAPINRTIRTNDGAILNLQSNYLSQLPKTTATVNDPIQAADAKILKLDPSIDNFISADRIPRIIWAWGESHVNSISHPPDLQRCTDGISLSLVSSNFSSTFNMSFNGKSKTIVNPQQLAFNISFNSTELASTTGYDNLTVKLNGNFSFLYSKTVTNYRYLPCSAAAAAAGCLPTCTLYKIDRTTQTFVKPFSSAVNYTVEGGTVNFFLTKPVLREQWYKNNRFDNILFSKRAISKAIVMLNDQIIASSRNYEFDTYNDSLGLFYIRSFGISNSSNIKFKRDRRLLSPTPLQKKNDSFSYLYQVNTTYNALGKNNLTIRVIDRFLNEFNKTETIASKKLSFNSNMSETGEVADRQNLRKSLEIKNENLINSVIGFGFLGLIIILLLRRSLV